MAEVVVFLGGRRGFLREVMWHNRRTAFLFSIAKSELFRVSASVVVEVHARCGGIYRCRFARKQRAYFRTESFSSVADSYVKDVCNRTPRIEARPSPTEGLALRTAEDDLRSIQKKNREQDSGEGERRGDFSVARKFLAVRRYPEAGTWQNARRNASTRARCGKRRGFIGKKRTNAKGRGRTLWRLWLGAASLRLYSESLTS